MPEDMLPIVCGLFCGSCTYLGNDCEGCDNVKEKSCWNELIGADTSQIYDCCVNARHYGHCSECSELLCERYNQVKDPIRPDQDAEKINNEHHRILELRALING